MEDGGEKKKTWTEIVIRGWNLSQKLWEVSEGRCHARGTSVPREDRE